MNPNKSNTYVFICGTDYKHQLPKPRPKPQLIGIVAEHDFINVFASTISGCGLQKGLQKGRQQNGIGWGYLPIDGMTSEVTH
jgi:hypothetical protein